MEPILSALQSGLSALGFGRSSAPGLFVWLAGLGLLLVGWIWLLVRAFRTRILWGLGVLILPPLGLVFAAKHFRRAVPPVLLLCFGLAAILSARFAENYFVNQFVGPLERINNGRLEITLTGWKSKDYSLLVRKPETVVLHMANEDVTDATLDNLTDLVNLELLDLSGTKVTDAGLRRLAGLKKLKTLRLRGTAVTDAGLAGDLAMLEALKQLDLRDTAVSAAAAQSWRAAAPSRQTLISPPKS